MTTQLTTVPTVFNFGDSAVRTLDRDGEIWFVAADVCAAIGHTNPSVVVRPFWTMTKRVCQFCAPLEPTLTKV